MKCGEARSLFSPYLDGAVTGTQMHALSVHLQDCSRCEREY
ncbi:MAG: anti-sigma factor, partial [Acidobacteria bacterium]